MKRIIALILALTLLCSLAACSKKDEPAKDEPAAEPAATEPAEADKDEGPELSSDNKYAQQIIEIFYEEIRKGTDAASILKKIEAAVELSCEVFEASEGYLNGFSEEVTGFKSCTAMYPMIGSQPFVCYIFEVENAEAYGESLKAISDPRWNICTEAEETIMMSYENYLLFAMVPEYCE